MEKVVSQIHNWGGVGGPPLTVLEISDDKVGLGITNLKPSQMYLHGPDCSMVMCVARASRLSVVCRKRKGFRRAII
jgi:hypothetical protein